MHGMPRAAHPLEEGRDAAGSPQLADQIDMPDIDSELQRCGCYQRLKLSCLEPLLRIQPGLFRQTPMVGSHCGFAQPLGEMAGYPLG